MKIKQWGLLKNLLRKEKVDMILGGSRTYPDEQTQKRKTGQIIRILMKSENKKVVLAYSGGLDTTYCAIYLKKVKGLEVHALTVNTGGFSKEELELIEKRARALGVSFL